MRSQATDAVLLEKARQVVARLLEKCGMRGADSCTELIGVHVWGTDRAIVHHYRDEHDAPTSCELRKEDGCKVEDNSHSEPKGGVEKTITIVNLASPLVRHGERVLLVDDGMVIATKHHLFTHVMKENLDKIESDLMTGVPGAITGRQLKDVNLRIL